MPRTATKVVEAFDWKPWYRSVRTNTQINCKHHSQYMTSNTKAFYAVATVV